MAYKLQMSNNKDMSRFGSFLKMPITNEFIDILTHKAQSVLANTNLQHTVTPPLTPLSNHSSSLPSLVSFIRNLVIKSRVQSATLFGTMVYLNRLKNSFNQIVAKYECACHRVLLAALIVAGKFLNDSSPKNRHWANYSNIFSIADINLMEKQMLEYLNFNLRISKEELLSQYSAFSHLPHSPHELAMLTPIPFLPSTPKSGIFPPNLKTPLTTHFPDLLTPSPNKYRKTNGFTPVVLSNILEDGPFPSPKDRRRNPYSRDITKLNHPSKSSSIYQRRVNRRIKPNKEHMLNIPTLTMNGKKMSDDILLPPIYQSNGPLSAPLGKAFPKYPEQMTHSMSNAELSPTYSIPSNNENLTLPPLRTMINDFIVPSHSLTHLLPHSG